MRIVLVGAVETSHVALETMVACGHPPVAVVTLPPERRARHSDYVDLAPLAMRHGIAIHCFADVNAPDSLAAIRAMAPDYVLVIGWSQICRSEFLGIPRRGAIGYHPTALPLDRGRAVIPWTILQGRRETGSTLFWLDDGMDSGDLLDQRIVPVADDETARSLYDKHLDTLARMLKATLPLLEGGDPPRLPQDHSRATYCAKRTAEDGLIDWSASAREVWTLIRAVGDPYAGAYTFSGGERLTVHAAELVGPAPYVGLAGQVQTVGPGGALVRCGDGEHVRLVTVQPAAGGAAGPAGNLLRIHARLGLGPRDALSIQGFDR